MNAGMRASIVFAALALATPAVADDCYVAGGKMPGYQEIEAMRSGPPPVLLRHLDFLQNEYGDGVRRVLTRQRTNLSRLTMAGIRMLSPYFYYRGRLRAGGAAMCERGKGDVPHQAAAAILEDERASERAAPGARTLPTMSIFTFDR
jgi:hypothetical protein